MQNTEVIVYGKNLANILVNSGQTILRTEFNIKDPKYRVFIFERTPECMALIEAYQAKHREGGRNNGH